MTYSVNGFVSSEQLKRKFIRELFLKHPLLETAERMILELHACEILELAGRLNCIYLWDMRGAMASCLERSTPEHSGFEPWPYSDSALCSYSHGTSLHPGV